MPPTSTTTFRAASHTSVWPLRPAGFAAVEQGAVAQSFFQEWKSVSQRSASLVVPDVPPNSRRRWRASS
ncbi:MAG: hypothetical protein QM704_05285 [Anaeromyxobacteraceae bacterium]